MRYVLRGISVLFAFGALALNPMVSQAEEDSTVFELRTYTTHDGRLPALEARFRDHTMALFEKHGMRNVGYWVPVDRPNTLIYIIAHESAEAIPNNWKSFVSDPAWQVVAEESQRDGQILVEGGIRKSVHESGRLLASSDDRRHRQRTASGNTLCAGYWYVMHDRLNCRMGHQPCGCLTPRS